MHRMHVSKEHSTVIFEQLGTAGTFFATWAKRWMDGAGLTLWSIKCWISFLVVRDIRGKMQMALSPHLKRCVLVCVWKCFRIPGNYYSDKCHATAQRIKEWKRLCSVSAAACSSSFLPEEKRYAMPCVCVPKYREHRLRSRKYRWREEEEKRSGSH